MVGLFIPKKFHMGKSCCGRIGIFGTNSPVSSMVFVFSDYAYPVIGSNKSSVCESHRVKWAFQFSLPELNEFRQMRIVRILIVSLPYENIQHVAKVRNSVSELSLLLRVIIHFNYSFALRI